MKQRLNIKAVMLAEGLRPSPLDRQVGLPAPLLPIREDSRLLDEWSSVLTACGLIGSPIDVVMASRSGFQAMESLSNDGRYERTIEPRSHRGTAGVLADLWRSQFVEHHYDYFIVIEGGSCPPRGLGDLAKEMEAGRDIVLGASEIDRYAGVIALKPEMLDVVPDRGFHDLKEQSLPKMLADGSSISAVSIIPRAIRVRTLESWLEAVRSTTFDAPPLLAERGCRVEGHCCIAGSASIRGGLIQNSIIMDGAVVEEGAIVARSAILPGQRVAGDARVIDSVFGVEGVHGTWGST